MVDDFGHSLDTFLAWPDQKIKWKIEVSGAHIESITAKAVSKNKTDSIFKDPPQKETLSTTWAGVIQNKAAIQANGIVYNGEINYDYQIVWQAIDTTKRVFDPRIQIK